MTVSAENVENVVSPPRKPVAMASLAASGMKAWFFMMPMKMPMRKPPIRLAASVPRGIAGKRAFNHRLRRQRNKAPPAAPSPTDKIVASVITFCLP